MKCKDQMGREVEIKTPPQRIISIVPSQTELLFDLGLEQEVVGITKFCVHPEKWFREKARVGGTKKLDFEKIALLQPDLIIGNKEENEEKQVKELMQKYPVWMSDIHNLEDALGMVTALGEITCKKEKAEEITRNVRLNFDALKKEQYTARNVLYFIWKEPYMVAGNDTFISYMMQLCNMRNVAGELNGRYPELTEQEIKELNPNTILLSSEPFPFAEKHIQSFTEICPDAKVVLVDGEYFSWYGSRLTGAPDYFKSLLNQMQ
jgi:ABC-type Fe3+-hydroxamate transport system substrate-binding protein